MRTGSISLEQRCLERVGSSPAFTAVFLWLAGVGAGGADSDTDTCVQEGKAGGDESLARVFSFRDSWHECCIHLSQGLKEAIRTGSLD